MSPMTLQFLIVMIASAINDRLQRKLDYVEEERRVLREQLEAATGGKRLSFTARQRRRLAEAGKLLTPEERRKCCQLVKPATILGWFRQVAARKYDSSEARRGRPGKPRDVRKLVIEMALANPGWGYTKIRDALRTGLAIEIGRTTVAELLAAAGIEPAPEREKKRTWKQFMKAHWDSLHVRLLQRRGPGARRDGSSPGLLRHRAQDARGGDCGDTRESRRRMDEADGTKPDRRGGRLSPGGQVPDPRSRPAVHGGVRDHSAGAWGGVREDPGAKPELQSACRTLRLPSSGRVTMSLRTVRGHRDITTTMRYAHLSPESRRDAVALLDNNAPREATLRQQNQASLTTS
jgi:hypothetical protein